MGEAAGGRVFRLAGDDGRAVALRAGPAAAFAYCGRPVNRVDRGWVAGYLRAGCGGDDPGPWERLGRLIPAGGWVDLEPAEAGGSTAEFAVLWRPAGDPAGPAVVRSADPTLTAPGGFGRRLQRVTGADVRRFLRDHAPDLTPAEAGGLAGLAAALGPAAGLVEAD
jgi:hypothetical protein